jgi:uncharacterized membrane protein
VDLGEVAGHPHLFQLVSQNLSLHFVLIVHGISLREGFSYKPKIMARNPSQRDLARVSGLKGLSWRIIATLTIIVIVYVKTGEIQFALEIGAIEFVIKYLLYFAHERAWARIPLGLVRK